MDLSDVFGAGAPTSVTFNMGNGQPAPVPTPTPTPAPAPAPVIDPTVVPNLGGPQVPSLPVPTQVTPQPQTPTPTPTPAPAPQSLESTGNAAVDAGVAMLQQVCGVTSADFEMALGNAVESGDLSQLNHTFIAQRFGAQAGYAIQLATAYVQDVQAQSNAAVAEIHNLAGGQAQWETAKQVFNATAAEPYKAAVMAMAQNGQGKEAAALLLSIVQSQGGIPAVTTPLMQPSAMGGAAGALSAAAFKEELNKLKASYPNQSLDHGPARTAYDALLQRRTQGRQLGY